jgi:transcription termination factor NusB
MYGLEKKERPSFEFELEQELKKDQAKTKELIKSVEEKIQELKNLLRQGAASEDFDNLGILLQGYVALQRVLNRIIKKK